MNPRYDESVEFLTHLYPEGPWVLTALQVDPPEGKRKEAPTETFYPGDDVAAWLRKYEGGTHNIYFSVNKPKMPCTKKASRLEIEEMCFLHVDVDPRTPAPDADKAQHNRDERERILALLTDKLPEGVPKPSAVTYSGGGYWGFWRLTEPFPIRESADRYEEAKLYNLQLEVLFGADSCHNVDRIARLPGTINYPDEKKRAKGRTAALAEVIYTADDAHPFSNFTKAPQVQAPRINTKPATIDLASVKRIESLDELPPTVPQQTKVMISLGYDPDDLTAGSYDTQGRSGPLFHVCCELVRQGVPDETIYSLITDPGWDISQSVVDGSNRNPDEYARRQIGRAKEYAVDPELAELNAKHTIALLGGAVRVLNTSIEQVPATGILAPKTTPTTPSGMELFYANRTKTIGTGDKAKAVPLWQWWTRHPLSARASGVVFAPEREVESGVFNLWHGFAVPPAPGDCQPFLDFVHRRMANGRDDVYEYILNWLALTVQRPWEPVGTALVLYSRMTGTGKNAFVDLSLGLILGHSFLYVTAEQHLFGQFSGHLATTVGLHLGEAATASSEKAEGLMKALVTDRTRMSERKGIDGVPVANCLHVLMSSNQDWILRVAPEDRRYCIVDVCEERMPKEEYVGLRKHMLSGGAAALHAFLAARDITRFDVVRDRPAGGVAELRQKAHSVEGLDAAWFEILQSGELPAFCEEREDGSVWLPSSSFLEILNLTRRPRKPYGSNLLRNLLVGHDDAGMGFEKERQNAVRQKGPQGYVIPPLAEARRRWDARRFLHTWDDDGEAGWIVPPSGDF